MTEADFIDIEEARRLLGWTDAYYRKVRGQDPSHPKRCRGQIIRWERKSWFDWFMNRGRRVA